MVVISINERRTHWKVLSDGTMKNGFAGRAVDTSTLGLERAMGFEPHSVAGSAQEPASRLLRHLRCVSDGTMGRGCA